MHNIEQNLNQEIGAAHSRALLSTEAARSKMQQAVDDRVYVSTLVHKASRMHKQDLRGYLAEHLSGNEVKAYLSLHDAHSKRPALQDKRQLQLCGILDSQEVVQSEAPKAKPQRSLVTLFAKTRQDLKRRLSSRPVSEWSTGEREQVKDVLQPFMELYDQL